MAARNYSSTAGATTLSAQATAGATSIAVTALVGYPSAPFYATIDRGTATEEVVLVTNVSGTTLTVTRAQSGTTAYLHEAGAAFEHTFVSADAQEANDHIEASTGVHGLPGGETVGSQEYTDSAVSTHAALTTGVHGVGASTVASSAEVDADVAAHAALTTGVHGVDGSTVASSAEVDADVAAHAALTTGVHGVGASTVASAADLAAHAALTSGVHGLPSTYVWGWEGSLTFTSSGAQKAHGQGKTPTSFVASFVAGATPLVITTGASDSTYVNLKAWYLDGTVYVGTLSEVHIVAVFAR